MRAGRATGKMGTRAGHRAAAVARGGGAALVATAAMIGASTATAFRAGKDRTAAFVRRAAATTRRTGARTAAGTAEAVRRGGGRATVATRRGTRRAARATRRAATRLVPEPVALPDEAEERGRFEPEPVSVAAGPAAAAAPPVAFKPEPASAAANAAAFEPEPPAFEPEPASAAANAAAFEPEPPAFEPEPAAFVPQPASVPPDTETAEAAQAVEAAAVARPAGLVPPDDGWDAPPHRRLEQGQVVPLRPRAMTRLKATGELLVLVAFLGLVVTSIIVALAVAGNQVLSGL
jgi:hypothetical protein